MKTKTLLLITFVACMAQLTAFTQTGNDLLGNWNADAPNAPTGFNTSIMRITEDSVFTTFTGENYAYTSTLIKLSQDTLIFEINGLDVTCTLRVENKTKLIGNAVWEGGESPLMLTKNEPEEFIDPVQK